MEMLPPGHRILCEIRRGWIDPVDIFSSTWFDLTVLRADDYQLTNAEIVRADDIYMFSKVCIGVVV